MHIIDHSSLRHLVTWEHHCHFRMHHHLSPLSAAFQMPYLWLPGASRRENHVCWLRSFSVIKRQYRNAVRSAVLLGLSGLLHRIIHLHMFVLLCIAWEFWMAPELKVHSFHFPICSALRATPHRPGCGAFLTLQSKLKLSGYFGHCDAQTNWLVRRSPFQ